MRVLRCSKGEVTTSASRSCSVCSPSVYWPPRAPCSSSGSGVRVRKPETVQNSRSRRRARNGSSSMPMPTIASASSASIFATAFSSASATKQSSPTSSWSITRCSFSIWRWAADCCRRTISPYWTKRINANAGRPQHSPLHFRGQQLGVCCANCTVLTICRGTSTRNSRPGCAAWSRRWRACRVTVTRFTQTKTHRLLWSRCVVRSTVWRTGFTRTGTMA